MINTGIVLAIILLTKHANFNMEFGNKKYYTVKIYFECVIFEIISQIKGWVDFLF